MFFKKENYEGSLFVLGVAFIIMGGMVFLGVTPRRMAANPVGGAWVGALILAGVGVVLLVIDRFLTR